MQNPACPVKYALWVLVVVSVPVNIDQKDGLVQLAVGSQGTYNLRFGRPAACRDLIPDSFDILWASMVTSSHTYCPLFAISHTIVATHFLDKAMN